jgi:hypothetical protein
MPRAETKRHLFWRGFLDLPAWQKGAIAVTGVMIAPMALFVLTATALSLYPLFLFGRFTGDLGKAPLGHDVKRAAKRARRRTESYYAAQPSS